MPNWRGSISWASLRRKRPRKQPTWRRNRSQHVRQRHRRPQDLPRLLHLRQPLRPQLYQRQLRLPHPGLHLQPRRQPLLRQLHRHVRQALLVRRRQRRRLLQALCPGVHRFRALLQDNPVLRQQCVLPRLVRLRLRPRMARHDRRALRRRAKDFQFGPAREAIKADRARRKECAPQQRRASPDPAARLDQAAHLPPDIRSGQAEEADVPRKAPSAARDPARPEEFRRLNPGSRSMHANRPRRAAVRRWTSDMPRANADFIRCEHAQAREQGAQHTWKRWRQSSASRVQ